MPTNETIHHWSMVYPNQIEPSSKAKEDQRNMIRAAFVYGERGINRMLAMKEMSQSTNDCQDPQQHEYSKLSEDKRNELGDETLSLGNSDCTSVMKTEVTIRIFGDGSLGTDLSKMVEAFMHS